MVTSGEDFFKRKEKLSHLMGTRPTQNDLAFVKWDKKNSMIKIGRASCRERV